MNARYVDLPGDALPCCVRPAEWDLMRRGRAIQINPHPISADAMEAQVCGGPFWLVIGDSTRALDGSRTLDIAACAHLIELDESALDAEVEAIAKSIENAQQQTPEFTVAGVGK